MQALPHEHVGQYYYVFTFIVRAIAFLEDDLNYVLKKKASEPVLVDKSIT